MKPPILRNPGRTQKPVTLPALNACVYPHCVGDCRPDRIGELQARIKELEALINTPLTADWMAAVPLEAAHQVERWTAIHDAGKSALDWFWLIGYLAQKAAIAEVAGDLEKAKHHTISTAAVLLNWHRRLSGEDTGMRPGTSDRPWTTPPAPSSTLARVESGADSFDAPIKPSDSP